MLLLVRFGFLCIKSMPLLNSFNTLHLDINVLLCGIIVALLYGYFAALNIIHSLYWIFNHGLDIGPVMN